MSPSPGVLGWSRGQPCRGRTVPRSSADSAEVGSREGLKSPPEVTRAAEVYEV